MSALRSGTTPANNIYIGSTPAAAAYLGELKLWPPAAATHFVDTFNRADSDTLGNGWTQFPGIDPAIIPQAAIISGTARTPAGAEGCDGAWGPLTSNDHSITLDVNAGSGEIYLLVRANEANQVMSWMVDGQPAQLYNSGGDLTSTWYYTMFTEGDTAYTATDADRITLAAAGDTYTLTANDTVLLTYTDTAAAYPYLDADHRLVAFIADPAVVITAAHIDDITP